MAYLFGAGRFVSALERARTLTMTPAELAGAPAANLVSFRPSRAAKHGSNAANPEVRWDGALMAPAGAGTYLVEVRAGERLRLVSSGTTSLTVQNQATKKFVSNAGAWSASATITATQVDLQVENLTACQSPTVWLKIVVTTGTSVTLWPRWNALVLYGHNLDPGLVAEARSSTDNFASSNVLEATGAILQPSFYMLQANGVSNRYGRLLLTGTNYVTPWYAVVAPVWLETGVWGPLDGLEVKTAEAQVRNEGRWGTINATNLSPVPRRVVKLGFRPNVAGALEVRQELVWRCRGGAYPLIVVPSSAESAVYVGRLSDSYAERRLFFSMFESDLILSEEPILAPVA